MQIFNFFAGPSVQFKSVLEQAHKDFLNYQNKGFHLGEISHRSKDYEAINAYAHEALLALYGLDADDWRVCFATGGATMQMSLCAMNFAPNRRVGMIDTDIWTKKAASEQRAAGIDVRIIASSADENYARIPALNLSGRTQKTEASGESYELPDSSNLVFATQSRGDFGQRERASGVDRSSGSSSRELASDDQKHPRERAKTDGAALDFVYLCSNNTVAGTQFSAYPAHLGDLVIDASSDFLSRPVDFSHIGAMFAGAQKNAGIAGITPVIVRKDFAERSAAAALPAMMKYSTHIEAASMYNTPPTWAVYIFSLVLKELERMGGLAAVAAKNERQAAAIYAAIDASEFYRPLVSADRSLMNICFASPSAELDAKFVADAAEQGILGIKGHRAKGGLRASIYNAASDEMIDKLLSFMKDFEAKN